MHIIGFLIFFLIGEKYRERYILSQEVIINDIKVNISQAGAVGSLIMVRFLPAKLQIDSRSLPSENQVSFYHILIIY